MTQIYVKDVGGTHTAFDVDVNDTLAAFREQVTDKTGIPPEQQRLIYKEKQLVDSARTLADYNITKGSTIHLLLGLHGGSQQVCPLFCLLCSHIFS